ncbi:conserved membrane protein of unknown function [Tenacibaculum jejuense]|uniref:Uncharacterized protein n=1 Tax=Tenacibaculum jejuense TaxID=584609 RepID=A0A238UC49_9FLAO|nr:conserved membrane protein of unknown function [Tenacibaculum jejuense]
MDKIFKWIYELLKWLAKITGFSYNEINVIVYYIIIPSLFLYLLSRIVKNYTIILSFLVFIFTTLLFIKNFKLFSDHLFKKSVNFLNWFQIIGLNYIQASVIICVFIPFLIILILLLYRKKQV